MTADTNNLEETLNDLSENKRHVLSEEAIIAKQHFDQMKDDIDDEDDDEDEDGFDRRQVSDIELFNENIKLLLSVFYRSQFDEYVYLLANPHRVYITNFLIGLIRGMSFISGVLIVLVLFLYAIDDSILKNILVLFQNSPK